MVDLCYVTLMWYKGNIWGMSHCVFWYKATKKHLAFNIQNIQHMKLIKRHWVNQSYFRHLLICRVVSRSCCYFLLGLHVADSFINREPCTCRPHLLSFMELHCSLSYQIWAEFFLLHQYRYVQSHSAFLTNNTVQMTDILKKNLGILHSVEPWDFVAVSFRCLFFFYVIGIKP